MSMVFNIFRGAYVQADTTGRIQPSIIRLSGITSGSGVLVSGVSVVDAEKNAIIQCFENRNHIYAFGHDPDNSTFSIDYTVFLGSGCSSAFKAGSRLKAVIAAYNKMKLSRSARTFTLTIGSSVSVRGIVLSANVSVFSDELNALKVTVSGKSMELI